MSVRLNGSTSGYTELDAPAVAGNNTIKMPASNGAANQLVKNSGTAGQLTYSQATEDSAGVFAFNSGYGSVAPVYGCRAWVNFDGTAAGTFAGGASTVTRASGSTTATITTTTAHGLTSGNSVYAASGVVAGTYTVTVLTSTTFTITTVATTALNAVAITFNFANIRASGNVNSVAKTATGSYILNFGVSMPDANYCPSCMAGHQLTSNFGVLVLDSLLAGTTYNQTASQVSVYYISNAGALLDADFVNVSIFR